MADQQNFEPGDVEVTKLHLINGSGTANVNITPQLISVDIYEDMGRATMYCEIMIQDGIDMIQNLPIIGEETFEISFKTPGQVDNNYPTIDLKFRIFSITNVIDTDQAKLKVYTLRGVSVEHINNSTVILEKSYKKPINEIVMDIMGTDLLSKKKVEVEETKGLQTLVIPSYNPLKAIDFLRKRAVSKKYVSSSFVFFETRDGFFFRTIEGLYEEAFSSKKPILKYRQITTLQTDHDVPVAVQLYNIMNYKKLTTGNTVREMKDGGFDSVVTTYDFITKSMEVKKFDLESVVGKFSETTKAIIQKTPRFMNDLKALNDVRGNEKKARNYFVPKDSSKGENFIDEAIPVRNAFATFFNQDFLLIYVYGNTVVSVGDVIDVELPTTFSTEETKEQKSLSGYYMVTKIRHIITPGVKMKHNIALELAKIGVYK